MKEMPRLWRGIFVLTGINMNGGIAGINQGLIYYRKGKITEIICWNFSALII
jgi:hypothetical protein